MAIGGSSNLRFTIVIILAVTAVVNSTSTAELDSTLAALRSHNYNLFANALTTSDLLFELHANLTTRDNNATIVRSFTLFAPPDSALFALDMTASALVYIQTLRYHIVPRRIAAADLLRLRPGTCLPTLLPWREIRVHRQPLRRAVVIAVEGVNVVVPGLYYGEGIAVHGLAGVLNFRSSQIGVRPGWSAVSEMNGTVSVPPDSSATSFPVNQTFIPHIPKQPVPNASVFSPIPRLPVFNHSIPPPALNSPLPYSSISSPPEAQTREGIEPPRISPAAEQSSVNLHDALTEDSTVRMRRHSAKLLEIGELTSTDLGDETAGYELLGENHEVETLKVELEGPSPENVESDQTAGGQTSDGLSHYTGYEL